MTSNMQVYFEGVPRPYPTTPWDIPGHRAASFQPLPADAATLVVQQTCSLFVNRHSDKRPAQITMDEAIYWGNDLAHDEMIFAQAKTRTSRFCLRMILDFENVLRHKTSPRHRAYQRLLRDAEFHLAHLSELEGVLVPVHYGMWLMDTGKWARKVLLSITQWCGMSWRDLCWTRANTEANRILVGRTFEALHDRGIVLCDLSSSFDFRQVMFDVNAPGLSQDDILNGGKTPCYIVGFSEARANHVCKRKLPILPLGFYIPSSKVGCTEIAAVLLFLKFMDMEEDVTPPIPAVEVLEWYDEYSRRYPTKDSLEVLLAQRAKFFPAAPPLYPGLVKVSFAGDDLYSEAVTEPGGDSDEECTDDAVLDDCASHGPVEVITDSLALEPVAVVARKLQRMRLEHLF
ncbi:hypothetical protein C8R46DRAFT_363315 [Mycena filopes]|nr:hypothetical protein C8R46DRAFT_363315 [Mycena filopes]